MYDEDIYLDVLSLINFILISSICKVSSHFAKGALPLSHLTVINWPGVL